MTPQSLAPKDQLTPPPPPGENDSPGCSSRNGSDLAGNSNSSVAINGAIYWRENMFLAFRSSVMEELEAVENYLLRGL